MFSQSCHLTKLFAQCDTSDSMAGSVLRYFSKNCVCACVFVSDIPFGRRVLVGNFYFFEENVRSYCAEACRWNDTFSERFEIRCGRVEPVLLGMCAALHQIAFCSFLILFGRHARCHCSSSYCHLVQSRVQTSSSNESGISGGSAKFCG